MFIVPKKLLITVEGRDTPYVDSTGMEYGQESQENLLETRSMGLSRMH